jgi:Tol biopolymer transport system component
VQLASQRAAGGTPNAAVDSFSPSVSRDGRFVGFQTAASDIVADDTNGMNDAFLWDGVTGETERVSVTSDGSQQTSTNSSSAPSFLQWFATATHTAVSSDGRYVAFTSSAGNLVPGDTNARSDVFCHDRATGATTRVSISSDGQQGTMGSVEAEITPEGELVAFVSFATEFDSHNVPGDVFVHLRPTEER